MPGIITHNKVFVESINSLKRDKTRNIFSKSIETLFRTKSFFTAGLFGAIGPNIFDNIPFFRTNYISGSEISYQLHSDKCEAFLRSIVKSMLEHKDKNTEWAATQRAYLFGLVSHLISDSVFHPFIYYWSGFAKSKKKTELSYFREQHIMFENNMDLYFNHHHYEDPYGNKFNFNLNEMLPLLGHGKTEKAISEMLIKSIKETFPDWNKKLPFLVNKKNNNASIVMDMLPYLIKLTYKIRWNRNKQLNRLFQYLKKKNILYSDYFVTYPAPSKINTHILNIHKERWFHPAGASGLHYESAKDLLSASSSRIIEIWKTLEEILMTGGDLAAVEKELKINSITGIHGIEFDKMQIQNPVRLRN